MSPDTEPEDSDHEQLLADPDDYHRHERLREIHDARQRVGDTIEDHEGYATAQEHSNQKSNLAKAVTLYIAEIEPLIEDSEHTISLPDNLPWDSVQHFADSTGINPDTKEPANYHESLKVYRACNRFLADVKPLIEDDDNDEWTV